MRHLVILAFATWFSAFALLINDTLFSAEVSVWRLGITSVLFILGATAWFFLWQQPPVSSHWQILAHHDELTGLLNRRGFWAASLHTPYCCLLIDIDDFKKINDKHGHTVGDNTLIALAQHLQRNTRLHDLCVRWGGDEFLLVLQHTQQAGGQKFLQRLQQDMQQNQVDFHISVGCADSNEADERQALIQLADARLLDAKQQKSNIL